MNDRTTATLLTTPDDEGQTRHHPPSPRSLDSLRSALTAPASALLDALIVVLHPPKSGVGILAACNELLTDIDQLIRSKGLFVWGPWRAALGALHSELRIQIGQSPSLDRAATTGLNLGPMSLLLVRPTLSMNAERTARLRELRARLIVMHLDNRRPFSTEAADEFARWFSGRQPAALRDAPSAQLADRIGLASLRSELSPESRAAKLLTLLISCFDTTLGPPPKAPEKPSIFLVAASANAEAEDQNDDEEDPEERSVQRNTATDLIGVALSKIMRSRPKDAAGVDGIFGYMQPDELSTAFRKMIADLAGAQSTTALSAILTTLCRARPRQFGLIRLSPADGCAVRIDLETGCLCWTIEAAISRKKFLELSAKGEMMLRPCVAVPLPAEVVAELRARMARMTGAKTLAELFEADLEMLDKDAKRYVRQLSPTSHRMTLERIGNSYGRFLLNVCKDETLAAAMALDFVLGTTANLNYWHLRARRIAEVATEVYRRLGFTGEIASSPVFDTGSAYVGKLHHVGDVLRHLLACAIVAVDSIHNKSSDTEIVSVHNMIAIAVLSLLITVTGHRKTADSSFAAHTVDLMLALAIIGDKRASPYHYARIVPLPSLAVAWLKFYLRWLELLRYRFARRQSAVARACDSILQSGSGRAGAPLLFVLDRRIRVKPIGTKTLLKAFKKFGLPTNIGRHWLASVLLAGGHDSAVVMAIAGRGAAGQEAYGARSGLDPMSVADAARPTIEGAIDRLALPAPPSLTARPYRSDGQSLPRHTPHGFRPLDESAVATSEFVERCPFNEWTLANSRAFTCLRESLCSAAQQITVSTLAACLVILDGIAHREELIAAVRKVVEGTIFGQDEHRYFLDTNTPGLGIRRAWLHPATVAVGIRISDDKPDWLGDDARLAGEIDKGLAAALPDLATGSAVVSPMGRLIDCAQAYLSLLVPGSLRAWMVGYLHARTLRPEAAARHAFGFVEHPRPGEGVRSSPMRRTHSDQFIWDALKNAGTDTENGGAKATRLAALLEELRPYEKFPLGDARIEVMLAFVIYLARIGEAPSSIKRYLGGAGPLIDTLVGGLDSIDQMAEAPWGDAVDAFRKGIVSNNKNANCPERTASNHLCACFGIDLRLVAPKDPAAAARRYADHPSLGEIERAIEVSSTLPLANPQRQTQPGILLKVIRRNPMRWTEASRVRVCDVDFSGTPRMVVTHEAIGTVKSKNTDRPLLIDDCVVSALAPLVAMRQEQYPGCRTYLFGDVSDPAQVEEIDDVRGVVNQSLYLATGSSVISAHDVRGLRLSELTEQFLSPAASNISALERRQAPIAIQVTAGHVDWPVTAANYVDCFDRLRRDWMDHLLARDEVLLSPLFLSSLTGIPADTLRARSRRNAAVLVHDPLEGFKPAEHPSFFNRVRHLKDIVLVERRTLVAEESSTARPASQRAPARYVSLRVLGVSPDAAAFESQLGLADQAVLDAGLNWLEKNKGSEWSKGLTSPHSRLRRSEIFKKLAETMAGWRPLPGEGVAIASALPVQPDGDWIFKSAGQAASLSNLWSLLDTAGIEAVVRQDASQPNSAAVRTTLQAAGIRRVVAIARRNFSGCERIHIGFMPKNTSGAAFPRVVRWTNFLISSAVLAAFFPTIGGGTDG